MFEHTLTLFLVCGCVSCCVCCVCSVLCALQLRKSTWKQYTDEEKAQSVLQKQQEQQNKAKGKGQQAQKKRRV